MGNWEGQQRRKFGERAKFGHKNRQHDSRIAKSVVYQVCTGGLQTIWRQQQQQQQQQQQALFV